LTGAELLEALEGQGVTLWSEGERLRYRGPREVLTPELLGDLRARKSELLDALSTDGEPVITSAREVFELARARFDTKPFDPSEHPPPRAEAHGGGTKGQSFARSQYQGERTQKGERGRRVDVKTGDPYDIYIGRWNRPYGLPASDWRNPFKSPCVRSWPPTSRTTLATSSSTVGVRAGVSSRRLRLL
jgi:tubulysin polyketide synthase-like protein